MEFVVVAKAHQILQQAFLLDLGAAVLNLHAAPVGLAGYQAVAFEQVADQGFGDGGFIMAGAQQLWRGGVLGAFHIQPVQQLAIHLMHLLGVEFFHFQQVHTHAAFLVVAAPCGFGQVGAQACQHFAGVGKAAVVEAVQVELEGLALDQIGRFAGDGEVHQCHLRLAAQIEPGQLESRPQVCAKERWVAACADFLTLGQAGNGKEQGGVVLIDIGRAFAQLRLFRSIHGTKDDKSANCKIDSSLRIY